MHFTWNRRTLVIAFAAALVGAGLLATPFGIDDMSVNRIDMDRLQISWNACPIRLYRREK